MNLELFKLSLCGSYYRVPVMCYKSGNDNLETKQTNKDACAKKWVSSKKERVHLTPYFYLQMRATLLLLSEISLSLSLLTLYEYHL